MNNIVVKNATWIIVCKIVQAVISLVLTMLTARYMGPSNYGLINYAASIVTFVVPIMQLGLNNILVREFISQPDKEGEIIGTAIVMSVISATCCIIGIISFSLIVNAGEKEVTIVCGLYSIMLIFQGVDLIEYWFQYRYLSKCTAIVSLLTYVVVSGYRISLLITSRSIFWFAITNVLDYFIISLSLLIIYKSIGRAKLRWSFAMAKRLIKTGKYYILSGLMVTIFSQTDKIMLKIMVNDAETGYYAAAINCVSATSFVFAAIIDSMRPWILTNKQKNIEKYKNSIIQLYSIIVYMALSVSLLITIFSNSIIEFLYGEKYLTSIKVLQILAWYTTFSYYGGSKDIWILAEGKQNYLVILNTSGAVMNIILNIMLIPQFGACGAAIASLFTQFYTNIIMGFIIKPLRENNNILLKALNPMNLKSCVTYITSRKFID